MEQQIMKILVTGSAGFVGKNFCAALKNIQTGKDKSFKINFELKILEYDVQTDPALLEEYCKECDFVFHLAGVNRPPQQEDFMSGNCGFTATVLQLLAKYHNMAPVLVTSSIQAALDNPYGQSKKAGEDLIFAYAQATGVKVLVYRLPNVFGKWCRPNYNSAVATFCHHVAHDLPLTVNDPNVQMQLVYIDDVVTEFIAALLGHEHLQDNFGVIPLVHQITLGRIVDLLYSFQANRQNLAVPQLDNAFAKALYSTYLSYLPTDQFSYPLQMNVDVRGSFTEIIRTVERGQFSVNISKPGITKGNHWHQSKNEKFVVVSGRGVIRFRQVGVDSQGAKYPVIEYFVNGEQMQVVDIPTGYTHNIENLGDGDLITFMWCNECFDPHKPDTFFEEV